MTDRILSQLIKLNMIDSEDEEIYRFGLEGLSLKLIHYTSYLVIAFLAHEMMRFLIFFAAFLVLRKNAGGYHAKTKAGCYISSCLTVSGIVVCFNLIDNFEIFLSGANILMILADLCIFIFAPVGNRTRVLEQEELMVFKKRSCEFLIFENLLVILLVAIGQGKYAIPVILAIMCEALLLLLEKTRKKSSSFLILAIAVFMTGHIKTYAQEILPDQTKEVVIVVDCSQSMQDADEQKKTSEFIGELAAVLPCNYQIGLVAFQDEIILSLPVGSSYDEISEAISQITYKGYGNAGAGLQKAVDLFDNEQDDKQIIMISDGEIVMKTEEAAQEAADLFEKSSEKAKERGIVINVLALGSLLEEGETVYPAAEMTNGMLYKLEDGDALENFADDYILEEMKVAARPVGKIDGASGELQIKLPDCLMKKARIILTGRQQNENLTVNCEADKINILKGNCYTVLELENPVSDEITIHMSSEEVMDVEAYVMAEYEFISESTGNYDVDLQQAEITICLKNTEGRNMISGHLADDGLKVRINGEESQYRIEKEEIILNRQTLEDEVIELELIFQDNFGLYFGNHILSQEIIVPEVEEPEPQIDWFFWCVILLFVTALLLLFFFAKRKKKKMPAGRKVIDISGTLPDESRIPKNDFCGKLQIYVIHNKEEIDYPPESINLFARCNREVITLEWILDACNLPFDLKGAEKVVIRPGEDKSLLIKNSGRVTAMKGRELLEKGHIYHLYYHEKVTFIFDQEDTEIEVHYKDLKPNER